MRQRKRRSYRNLPIDRKLSIAFGIPLCLMLILSLILTEIALSRYDQKIYSYEADQLNSIIDRIEDRLDTIDSISYSVAMDDSIQRTLYELSEASVTEYRFGMLAVYRDMVAALLQSELTENFIYKDNRLSDFRTGEQALLFPEDRLDSIIEDSAAEQGALYIELPSADDPYLISARHIRHYLNADLRDLGTLVFITRMEDIAGKAEREDGSSLLLMDQDGSIIYGNADMEDEVGKYKGLSGYAIDEIAGRRYFISSALSGRFQCISIFPYSSLFSLTTLTRALLILSFMLLYIVVFTAIRHITRSITEPIRSLSASMMIASDGHLDEALDSLGDSFTDDEIGKLGNEYRSMIIRLRTLIKENYEKQILLKDTRYRMLRAQINPHFLYNTLNSIGWMIKLGKTEESTRMLQALGNLLHRAFSRNMLTTLGEEMILLDDYAYIQGIRYGERFSLHVDIPDSLKGISIPPLTIQPLVENALQYGPDVTGRPVSVTISAQEEGTHVMLTVEDNGPGFSEERLEEVRSMTYKGKGSGIGIKNIRSRLSLIYGEEASLEISSAESHTMITITIPERISDVQDTSSR